MQITLGSLQIKMFEILAAIKTPEDAVRLNVVRLLRCPSQLPRTNHLNLGSISLPVLSST